MSGWKPTRTVFVAFGQNVEIELRAYRSGAEITHRFPAATTQQSGLQSIDVVGLPANLSYLTANFGTQPCQSLETLEPVRALTDVDVLKGKFVHASNAQNSVEGTVVAENGSGFVIESTAADGKKYVTELPGPALVRASDLSETERMRLWGGSALTATFAPAPDNRLMLKYVTPDITWGDEWHVEIKSADAASKKTPCDMYHYFTIRNRSGVVVRSSQGATFVDGTNVPDVHANRSDGPPGVLRAMPLAESRVQAGDDANAPGLSEMRIVHADRNPQTFRDGRSTRLSAEVAHSDAAYFCYFVEVTAFGGVSPVKYELVLENTDKKYVSCRSKFVVRGTPEGEKPPPRIIGTATTEQTWTPRDEFIRATMGYAENVKRVANSLENGDAVGLQKSSATASGTILNPTDSLVYFEIRIFGDCELSDVQLRIDAPAVARVDKLVQRPAAAYRFHAVGLSKQTEVKFTAEFRRPKTK